MFSEMDDKKNSLIGQKYVKKSMETRRNIMVQNLITCHLHEANYIDQTVITEGFSHISVYLQCHMTYAVSNTLSPLSS